MANELTDKRIKNHQSEELITKHIKELNLKAVDFYTITDLIEYSKINDTELINDLSAILILLFLSLKDGSLCIKLDEKWLESLKKSKPDIFKDIKNIIKKFLNNINLYKEIITDNENEYKPLIFKEYKSIPYIYFQKYYILEQNLKTLINNHLNNESESFGKTINNNIIYLIKDSPLNTKQKIAVFLSLLKNLTVISGGPGTGKTYIIYWILKALTSNNFDLKKIKMAAPTGRASERLTESVKEIIKADNNSSINPDDIEAETIHRMLKYSPAINGFIYNQNNKLPFEAIIIDEISMIDIELMVNLFSALKNNTKVILLGDKDQLPSVEAGAVLTELISENFKESFSEKIKVITEDINFQSNVNNFTDRIVILDKNYRSAENIKKIAVEINNQNIGVISEIEKIKSDEIIKKIKGFSKNINLIKPEKYNYKELYELLKHWSINIINNNELNYIESLNKLSKLSLSISSSDSLSNNSLSTNEDLNNEAKRLLINIFKLIENNRILAVTKESTFGTKTINNIMKQIFTEKLDFPNEKIITGLPIMIVKNNYSLKLFNGDIGIIIKDTAGFKAVFKKGEKIIIYPLSVLPFFELSFAITVHKSQGSEYKNILFIMPEDINNSLLTKEILYTAITRAKSNVFIYSKTELLEKTISTKVARISGINSWN